MERSENESLHNWMKGDSVYVHFSPEICSFKTYLKNVSHPLNNSLHLRNTVEPLVYGPTPPPPKWDIIFLEPKLLVINDYPIFYFLVAVSGKNYLYTNSPLRKSFAVNLFCRKFCRRGRFVSSLSRKF